MLNVVAQRVTAYSQHKNYIAVSKDPLGKDQKATEYYFVPLSDPRISPKGNDNVVGSVSLEAVTAWLLRKVVHHR